MLFRSIRLKKLLNFIYSYPDFYDPRSVILTDQNLLVPGSLVLPTQKVHNQNRNNYQNYLPHNYNEHQSGLLNIQCHREREENKKKNNNSSFFNAISHRNMCGQPSLLFSSLLYSHLLFSSLIFSSLLCSTLLHSHFLFSFFVFYSLLISSLLLFVALLFPSPLLSSRFVSFILITSNLISSHLLSSSLLLHLRTL